MSVDILILGLGFTGEYIRDEAFRVNKTVAATTTTGRDSTIQWKFDPAAPETSYRVLPITSNIVITFPILDASYTSLILRNYLSTHSAVPAISVVLLGSTGVYSAPTGIVNRSGSILDSERVRGENGLLAMIEENGVPVYTAVLALAGLFDHVRRRPVDWVARVATSKEKLGNKGALNLVHGKDVGRAVVRLFDVLGGNIVSGERWVLSDLRLYDWWAIALGSEKEGGWVLELMSEKGVIVLPRDGLEKISRVIDAVETWVRLGITPEEK
ncbi:hypothetical protein HK096_000396, partial [Nowakowskiella sp. JEL0078]